MIRIRWPWKRRKTSSAINHEDYWYKYYQTQQPGMPKRPYNSRRNKRGLAARITVALVLLLVLVAAREVQLPAGQQVRDNVRHLLTAEWDFRPLMDGAVRVAGQVLNWDNPTFHTWPNPGPTVPVGGENISSGEYLLPVSGTVVREYGWNDDPLDGLKRFYPGVYIDAKPGTPVRAVMYGQIVKVDSDKALGDYVLIDHGGEIFSMYAGLQNIIVKVGQWVWAGQDIAEVGEVTSEEGAAAGGLHFELRENGELVDPLSRLQMSR